MDVAPAPFLMHVLAKSVLLHSSVEISRKKKKKKKTCFLSRLLVKSETFMFIKCVVVPEESIAYLGLVIVKDGVKEGL